MLTTFCFFLLSIFPGLDLEVKPPMNRIYHPVSTTNPEAQAFFNKGLTYVYAYNHDLAYRSFVKAAELDPNLAMAYWGMAIALGQNVNVDVTRENEVKCYNFVQQALKLAPKASKNEQDYINALKVRYTDKPDANLVPLRFQYRNAMKKVVEAYPEDLDAATLYAESILMLNPWKWWTYDGKPKEGVLEAAKVLRSVLDRNPQHIGANHFYIHAYEESPFPERALASANRLESLFLQSGHLLHMPCHIFVLMGDYERALNTNKKAVAADLEYFKEYGTGGEYPEHYMSHNLSIMTHVYMLMEDYENAFKTAIELNQFIKPLMKEHFQHLHHFTYLPLEVLLYFHKWKEVLAYLPIMPESPLVNTYQRFSRALAQASLGNIKEAEKEKKLMLESKKNIPESEEIANNPPHKVFELAELVINAALSKARGNIKESIDYLYRAVDVQDKLDYDEPPAWYVSLRAELGAALLQEKEWDKAADVFKEGLTKLRRNGRLLYGLSRALKGQKREIDAYWVEREMKEALRFSGHVDGVDQILFRHYSQSES